MAKSRWQRSDRSAPVFPLSSFLLPSGLETEGLNWIVVDLGNKSEDYELKILRAEFLLVSNI